MIHKIIQVILFIGLNFSLGFGGNIFANSFKSIDCNSNVFTKVDLATVVISGNIFNDPDGGNVNNSTGVANLIPNNIYATLVNFNGTVTESVLVATNGAFAFSPVVEDEYIVLISINQGDVNQPSPIIDLPDGWQNTGEFNGPTDGGTDSQIDGTSELIQANMDYTTINFGIKSATALPMDLIYFKGNRVESHVNLTWKTSNEKDFSHFEIERSINGKVFEKIGQLNIYESKIYQFLDRNPHWGHVGYYRLKMVDLNGKCKFSKIILVNSEEKRAYISMENPIQNGQFQVQTNLENPVFRLINSIGKPVNIQFSEKENSSYTFIITNANSGIYFLIIEAENQIQSMKVVMP